MEKLRKYKYATRSRMLVFLSIRSFLIAFTMSTIGFNGLLKAASEPSHYLIIFLMLFIISLIPFFFYYSEEKKKVKIYQDHYKTLKAKKQALLSTSNVDLNEKIDILYKNHSRISFSFIEFNKSILIDILKKELVHIDSNMESSINNILEYYDNFLRKNKTKLGKIFILESQDYLKINNVFRTMCEKLKNSILQDA